MTRPTVVEKHFSLLYVEDNPLDVELVRHCLESGGLHFDLTVVDTRARFEQEFAVGRFDLVLGDYSLPDFDGHSALRIVRERDPRLPFVFVSGVLGEDVAVETLLQGATDYVLKNKLDRLLPAVRRALNEHEEHASRERAEQELRQVEQRFRTITNNLPAMVWTCSPEGALTFSNSLWNNSVGPAESWFDAHILHPSDLATCHAVWNQAQGSGAPFEVECRYRTVADGSFRWNLVRATPLLAANGSLTEWVGTCTETEQQKRRESQFRITEKLAMTGRLASVIAHEINNPLEALTNLFYLMRNGSPGLQGSPDYLALAEHELIRISAITKQTLQWSRDEAIVSEVSVDDLIKDALKLFAAKLKNKRITLEQSPDSNVRVRVIAGEIRQVLANLISNAIDAVAPGGKLKLAASVESRRGRDMAALCVEDDGQGIAPEVLTHLFKPFQSTKGDLGTGLGLYVSRELVDRYGGELILNSTPGHGTRAVAYLPLA